MLVFLLLAPVGRLIPLGLIPPSWTHLPPQATRQGESGQREERINLKVHPIRGSPPPSSSVCGRRERSGIGRSRRVMVRYDDSTDQTVSAQLSSAQPAP